MEELKDAVILFAGRKGSGKNTVADVFEKVARRRNIYPELHAYADELRNHLSIMNPIVGWGEIHTREENSVGFITWNTAIDMYGYEEAKVRFPEMRRLMQTYGTEVVRDRVHAAYWTEKLVAKILKVQEACIELEPSKKTVQLVTDVRFKNESSCWGPAESCPFHLLLIYVDRPLTDEEWHAGVDPHRSENFDWILNTEERILGIRNTGTLDELQMKAESLANDLFDQMPGFQAPPWLAGITPGSEP